MFHHTYCGFLERKLFSISTSSTSKWTLYWFVFSNGILSCYSDETEQKLLGKYLIDESYVVQVLPGDGNREYIFEIKENNTKKPLLILSCPNVIIIESWIIALLQAIHGTIRDSENFSLGTQQNSKDGIFSPFYQPLHDHPVITSVYQLHVPGTVDEPILPPHVDLMIGKFMKRSLHKNSWKERWIVLNQQELSLYTTEEDAIHSISSTSGPRPISRGNRRLHIGSKIALLPIGFENQKYCFALITSSPLGSLVTLRLSCDTFDQLQVWITSLKIEILHLLHNYEKEQLLKNQQYSNSEVMLSIYNPDKEELNSSYPPTSTTLDGLSSRSSLSIFSKTTYEASNSIRRYLSFQNKSSQAIVFEYFTTPISLPSSITSGLGNGNNSQYLVVSVFENQRFLPLTGWKSSFLVPFTDYPAYSNLVGVKYPFTPHLNRSPPPLGCQWLFKLQDYSSTSTSGCETNSDQIKDEEMNMIREEGIHDIFPSPSSPLSSSPSPAAALASYPRILGLYDFEIDNEYTTTDSNGWVYAASFDRFLLHLSENSSHTYRKGRDLVRRRKWIRIAQISPTTTTPSGGGTLR